MGKCDCLPCCKEKEDSSVIPEGGIDANRGCTDICCIPLFIVFVIGWIVVAGIAFANGDPYRIVRPNDYEGNVCGEDGQMDKAGEKDLSLRPNIWLPIPSPNYLDFGICVERCPEVGELVCKYDREDESTFRKTSLIPSQCWIASYKSNATLWRCLPFDIDVAASASDISENLQELADTLSIGTYVKQGFNEVYAGRWAIFLSGWTALLVTLLWVFLMRFIIKPIVYFTIIAVFFLMFGIGWWCYQEAEELEDFYKNADLDKDGDKQIKTYRAFAYIFWIFCGIYLMLLIWLLGRIRIAIEVIKESGKALLEAKTMVLIPPISFVLLLVLGIWWVSVAAYIHSTYAITDIPFSNSTALATTTGTVINTGIVDNSTATSAVDSAFNYTYTVFQHENATELMQLYNLFGFFWTMNFILAIGYFTICSTVVCWFFSEPTGSEKDKHVPALAVVWSFKRALRYHLGSLIFGSLLIAIIQTIRFVMNYMAKKMGALKDNQTAKIVLAILNCCLLCLERIVNFINKNAYIVIAIKGYSFCRAAGTALKLLIANVLRVATTSFISTFTLFLCKVLIMVTNVMIGGALLVSPIPSEEIKSGIFPAIVIGVITFVVATMFMNIYDDCIDTVLMCFFMDDEQDNREQYYMPKSLAKLVDKYTKIEEMRKEADRMMSCDPDNMEDSNFKPIRSVYGKKIEVAPSEPKKVAW